ncbi:MAG: DEAD/DEAH box helicase [Acidobacteriota bacterium]
MPFASFNLDSRLLEGVRDLGFKETRPIQTAVIPLALAGHDLIACAATGTGKTAAFVVPMLQWLLATASQATGADGTGMANVDLVAQAFSSAPRSTAAPVPPSSPAAPRKSRVLVLAPTRELAVQIEDEIHGVSYHTAVTSAAVYGGVEMGIQERALRAGVDIIVATPGRLMDHMRQQNADLSGIELLVLDEADRMMDMGFWPDVRRIITAMKTVRQTLLFSATMPEDVVRLALEIVREPKYVQVGQRSAVAKTITHRAHIIPGGQKLDWLIDHLKRPEGPVLIFSRTKIGADRLARRLAAAGIRCIALHADRTMEQRRQAVEGFRGGRYTVMVATDIAARGLDIDGIHTVINFELPDSADSYVHRVGRTGRADVIGHALTLVQPDEREELALLEKSVGVCFEEKSDDVRLKSERHV